MLIKLVTRQDNTFFEVNIVTISKLEFKSGTWVCSLKEMESTKILVLTNIDAVTPNFSMYSQHTTLNVLWHHVQNNSPSPCFFATPEIKHIYTKQQKRHLQKSPRHLPALYIQPWSCCVQYSSSIILSYFCNIKHNKFLRLSTICNILCSSVMQISVFRQIIKSHIQI